MAARALLMLACFEVGRAHGPPSPPVGPPSPTPVGPPSPTPVGPPSPTPVGPPSPTPVGPPKPTPKPTPACEDKDTQCRAWADAGECEHNPDYMLASCKRSCGLCPPSPVPSPTPKPTPAACEDKDAHCPAWADAGECEHNPDFMLVSCKRSCGLCPPSPVPSPTPKPSPKPTPKPTPAPTPKQCSTPVECHGALRRKGNRIVDKTGKNVQLDGMSMFWSNWAAPFWNADVVKYLVNEWKISLVRCPVGVGNPNPVDGGYLSDPDKNKAELFKVVDAAIEAGIYAIIDWHVEGHCDAGQSKPFFAEMAEKYGKHPNVMWETCNEPTGWGWNGGLRDYHEAVIPTIRAHSSNLIIAGTNTWSQDVDEASQNPLSDSNVAYTLHFYSSNHKQPIRDKASTAMNNGAAIFVTEWGVEQNNEGHSETNTWLGFLKEHGISNANWGIYDKDSEAWAIVHHGSNPNGGWSDSEITESGHFMRDYLKGSSPSGPTPSPTPGPPGPGPPGPGVKRCNADRGSCDCDCSWASGATCGYDDGSCCHGCCCNSLSAPIDNATLAAIVV